MPSKIDLRRHFRRQRQSLTPAARQRAEKRINNLLKGYLKRGKRLAIYWPIGRFAETPDAVFAHPVVQLHIVLFGGQDVGFLAGETGADFARTEAVAGGSEGNVVEAAALAEAVAAPVDTD